MRRGLIDLLIIEDVFGEERYLPAVEAGTDARAGEAIRRSLVVGGIDVVPRPNGDVDLQVTDGTSSHRADFVVIAAGAWSGRIARRLQDPVLLESERGYNATLPDPGVTVGRPLIFAERKFVAIPLSSGLRIGGAAEFGGLHAAPNDRRADALVAAARRFLPMLTTQGATRWAGHRPATPDGLPVIGGSPHHPRVLYAFGHGHLGLTQAATTGRLIVDRLLGRATGVDLTPYNIERFA